MISINDIMVKREMLYSLAPFSDAVKSLKRRTDLIDFTFSDLRLYGSSLAKEGVIRILEGEILEEIPVFEHRLCEAHKNLLTKFEDITDMGMDIDSAVLNEFSMIISGTDIPRYRDGSPLLYHLGFVPCDTERITSELTEALAFVKRYEAEDVCLKAAMLHNKIIKVYPFTEGLSELSARAAMQYTLIKEGFFTVDIGISESEYNRLTADSVQSDNDSALGGILKNAIYKKLNYLVESVESGV